MICPLDKLLAYYEFSTRQKIRRATQMWTKEKRETDFP